MTSVELVCFVPTAKVERLFDDLVGKQQLLRDSQPQEMCHLAIKTASDACAGGTFHKRPHANLPVCWLAPGPPVRRTNQNRLISPYIVPNPRFSAAWKTRWQNAGLVNFANFQIAIVRRELDR